MQPAMPVAQADLEGVAFVPVESASVRLDPVLIEHVQICLIIQGQGAIVQIGGQRGLVGSPWHDLGALLPWEFFR